MGSVSPSGLPLTGCELGSPNGLDHKARLACRAELTALSSHARREYPHGRCRLAHVGDRRDVRCALRMFREYGAVLWLGWWCVKPTREMR